MERWVGKVAMVTGASAGIGEAIVEALAEKGVKVVGLARRVDKLQQLSSKLGEDKFYPLQCDMRKEPDILKAFKWLEENLGGADILVNNAGVLPLIPIIDSPTEEYHKTIETNLIAPTICAREFVQSIKKRNAFGHIININSVAGHYAESIHMPLGMYCASKYGLTALGSELRHEIIAAKLNVKVTSISPGVVRTDMVKRFIEYTDVPALESKDIAEAVMYAVGTPESVEIPEITMIPHGSVIGSMDIPNALKK